MSRPDGAGAVLAARIRFTLDGRAVEANPGESLLEVADREGFEIPRLCWAPGLPAAGNCRACVVEVDGERTLAAACCRAPTEGMAVRATSERARRAQALVLELLAADTANATTEAPADDELARWRASLGAEGAAPRFAARAAAPRDTSHPAIAFDPAACIQCTRCVRACRDVQGNDVIGLAFRGAAAAIVFDQFDALGASTCVACGECVQACPTGALLPADRVRLRHEPEPEPGPSAGELLATQASGIVAPPPAARTVDSLCPYCGVGCQVRYTVEADAAGAERIVQADGRDGPANRGRLCVKGRFGFDYVRHPERLTVPLLRRDGVPKGAAFDPAKPLATFREASWDEAMAAAAAGFLRIRDAGGAFSGAGALGGFGSAKGSNEEAYLFQKLVRAGFASPHVDHCTRLCHASSVAALLEGIGSGAVSNPVRDVLEADCVIVIGANPTVNHPVAATWIKNAVEQRGTKLVVIDPRGTDLARHAAHVLRFSPDTDVALLNAMLHVIVAEGLVDRAFVEARTTGFEAFAANLAAYSPEAMEPVCGVAAGEIRAVARLYATSPRSMILWGMGISQHVHGTDNARCLIALALATGQIGRPGTGLHPLRGQNNVQGASDAGLIPMMYPDYRRVDAPGAREDFAALWRVPAGHLPAAPGMTVTEILGAAAAGTLKGLFVMGENPAMSDPDAAHARQALAALEHLVVQDLFLTETARFADVVLPAGAFAEKWGTFTNTDRTLQLARPVLAPPGGARPDLAILLDLAARLGLDVSGYGDPAADLRGATAAVFDEMRRAMPSIAGIGWARLEREGAVTYPCRAEGDPGEPVVFTERFPTADGRARFVPVGLVPADERPDGAYPLVLITGRQLEHWHTGTMTRRSGVLDAIEPEPVAMLHPAELEALGIAPGEALTLETRRGAVTLWARADEAAPRGAVFAAFCWTEAAVNLLTNPALDPVAKIPEFKFCAVRVRRADAPVTAPA